MIHRSFKPAKCKTELKLAISRIKLLKNKRGAQLKQLKREVAQLLESGQIQNAKIRVEHVVKEEKTIAAYDLIEVYCELIAARMPIIESQKNCPIDLKEPICGVTFASPRCSEIPELRKVSKQLTRKYGREFLSAAVELRPDCGVNHLLVNKLSAKGSDSQAKLKTLNAIAEEQNIKWDPQQLEEKNPNRHGNLPNGRVTVEKASNLHKESAHDQAPHSRYKKKKSDIRPSHQNKMNMDPTEFIKNYDARWSLGSQNVAVAQNGVSKTLPSESRLSGSCNGNMEFKDAASAAQAAAESAELASIAARAAAELSSLGNATGQGSDVPDTGLDHHARDERTAHGARSYAQSETSDLATWHDDFVRSNSTLQQEGSGESNEAYFAGTPEKINDGPDNDRSSSMHSKYTSMELESSMSATHDDHLKPPDCDIKDEMMHLTCDSCLQDEELAKDATNGALHGEYIGTPQVQFDKNELHKVAEISKESPKGSERFDHSASMKSIQDSTSVSSLRNIEQANSCPPYFEPESYVAGSLDEKESNTREFEEEFSIDRQEGSSYEKNDTIEDRQFREQPSHSFDSHSKGPSTNHDSDFPSSSEEELVDASVEDPFTCFDDENFKGDFLPESSNTPVVYDDYRSDGDGDVFELDKGPETGLFNLSPGRKFSTCLSSRSNTCSLNGVNDDFLGKDTSHLHFPGERHSHPVVPENLADSSVLSQSEEALSTTFGDTRGNSGGEEGFNEENRSSGPPQDVRYAELLDIVDKQATNFSNITDQSSDDDASDNDEEGHIHAHPPDSSSAMESKSISYTLEKPHTLDDTKALEESTSDGHVELNLEKLTGGLKHKPSLNSPYKKSPTADADEDPPETIVHSSIPKQEPVNPVTHGDDAYYQKGSAKLKKQRGSINRNTAIGSKRDDGAQPLPQESLKDDTDSYYKKSRPLVNKKSSTTNSANFFDSTDTESDSNAARRVPTRKAQAPTNLSWRTKDVSSESSTSLKAKLVSKESSAPLHDPKSAGPSGTARLKSPLWEQPSNVHQRTATSVKTESPVTAQDPSKERSSRRPSHVHPKLPDYDDLAAHLLSLRTNKF